MNRVTTCNRLQLRPQDVDTIDALVDSMVSEHGSSDELSLLDDVSVLAATVPIGVRRFLNAFRLEKVGGYCVISGHGIDDARIGATPSHWRKSRATNATLREETRLLLYASVLGDPFGWRSQQNGRIVHDVVPVKGDESSQLASGSGVQMQWHTEDAYFAFRGDYVILGCLRNPDRISTTVAEIDISLIPSRHRDTLFGARFEFKADGSHTLSGTADIPATPVAVLFGDRRSPYVRVDPPFMKEPGDPDALSALSALASAIEARLTDIPLAPGDLLIIDNFRCVHGRRPFSARYDSADRWLQRVNVTRDLKRSSGYRASVESRVIVV